jgi:hypothetical protein
MVVSLSEWGAETPRFPFASFPNIYEIPPRPNLKPHICKGGFSEFPTLRAATCVLPTSPVHAHARGRMPASRWAEAQNAQTLTITVGLSPSPAVTACSRHLCCSPLVNPCAAAAFEGVLSTCVCLAHINSAYPVLCRAPPGSVAPRRVVLCAT